MRLGQSHRVACICGEQEQQRAVGQTIRERRTRPFLARDVSGAKPGFFDFVGTAKYEAWAKLKGTAQDDAKKKYVELVKKLAG